VDKPQRERIHDDLKGLVRGECLFDDLSRALYSTDASIFEIEPLGVVAPRDEAEVQALVRYAMENGVSLVPRGAGTGLAGESLGTGLIIDLSRHFRSILSIEGDQVRVQPGVVHRHLNAYLARQGYRFAPDPSSGTVCTLGGMLATNASGSRVLRHGYTRDHVVELRAVLDSGEAVTVGKQPRWPQANAQPGRLEDIISSVATLLEQNAEAIRTCRPRTPYNRCGYALHDVLTAESLDLARLLVGSEGTLAIFTEATLRTIPLPLGRALILVGFPSLESVLRGARLSLASAPAACELLDRRLLALARSSSLPAAPLIPNGAEAALLIEFEAESPGAAQRAAADLAQQLYDGLRLAVVPWVATATEEIERCWELREAALPSLFGLRGGVQPLAFIEDVGVPPEDLALYLHRVQDILQRHETTASFFIHAATGQVHARPFLDLRLPGDVAKLWAIADEVYAVVLELGGTISTQHGTGLARTPWVGQQYRRLYPVFRELKAIFDPRRVFNPGKIIGPDPGVPAWPLRRSPTGDQQARAEVVPEDSELAEPAAGAASLSPSLLWPADQVREECQRCNGCGHCRTEEPAQRMCPIFRGTHAEEATPRAKANLFRHLLQPGGDPQRLSSEEVRLVADLCVNCKMCAVECPAHVDIPRLMLEAKAANVARHGLDRRDWAMARTEGFARLGSAWALPFNSILRSRTFRWLLEAVFGVSRQRRLPAFAARNFLRRARRRGWTRRPLRGRRPRVAYFVDVFANYNDPLIAEAVMAVLQHNDIDVFVPPGQRGCGMAPLAYGDVDAARETVEHNAHLLADLVRDGYTILCSEPTAALMWRHDARYLLDDPDIYLVAEHTAELTAYLSHRHRLGKLRTDFHPLPLAVGHHVPCHLKALGGAPAGPELLSLIPGLRVLKIDVSCSGMAGTFGLQARNYGLSLEAGGPMLQELARPSVLFGSTECSTCRLQMEDGACKRTLHPVQYLALAYGYLPELVHRLKEPIRDLVL
jgi:FAD/FMN-containing dehydrogenase/Fe-S oxidoreductase